MTLRGRPMLPVSSRGNVIGCIKNCMLLAHPVPMLLLLYPSLSPSQSLSLSLHAHAHPPLSLFPHVVPVISLATYGYHTGIAL